MGPVFVAATRHSHGARRCGRGALVRVHAFLPRTWCARSRPSSSRRIPRGGTAGDRRAGSAAPTAEPLAGSNFSSVNGVPLAWVDSQFPSSESNYRLGLQRAFAGPSSPGDNTASIPPDGDSPGDQSGTRGAPARGSRGRAGSRADSDWGCQTRRPDRSRRLPQRQALASVAQPRSTSCREWEHRRPCSVERGFAPKTYSVVR
jgi:hypothetical protein